MATINAIQESLIRKILAIQNKSALERIDALVSIENTEQEPNTLTKEQKQMLEMSNDDLKKGDVISQDDMNARNLKWLNEK